MQKCVASRSMIGMRKCIDIMKALQTFFPFSKTHLDFVPFHPANRTSHEYKYDQMKIDKSCQIVITIYETPL